MQMTQSITGVNSYVLRKFGLVNATNQSNRAFETLINLFIVSNRDVVVKAGIFDTGIADHRLIYTPLKL